MWYAQKPHSRRVEKSFAYIWAGVRLRHTVVTFTSRKGSLKMQIHFPLIHWLHSVYIVCSLCFSRLPTGGTITHIIKQARRRKINRFCNVRIIQQEIPTAVQCYLYSTLFDIRVCNMGQWGQTVQYYLISLDAFKCWNCLPLECIKFFLC
jgi:hypothetical protein